jgi:tripartite ATP-independent transporter DctM subunit
MYILLLTFVVFLVIGIPIAYSLGLSALCYFAFIHPEFVSTLPQLVFAGMNSYAMIALPLFVLMGLIMNEGGITARLIDFCSILVGRFRGGLGAVNVVASMIFGGISGSSVSDTASIGAILIPEMEKKGYPPKVATGVTVASSTMGMIIPPSVPMVVYAMVAEESVGKLFLGSLIPGVMIGLLMLGITLFLAKRNNYPRETITFTPREALLRVLVSVPALIMPVVVIGSVVMGIVTPTESAGIGVLYALIYGLIVTRGRLVKRLPSLVLQAVQTSANVMIIIALSQVYIWILAMERVPLAVAGLVAALNLPPFLVILVVVIIILIAGTFIDVSPGILLLTPVFLPAMQAVGVNAIQFGVLLITGLAIGLVTPPVGMCLNVASTISRQSIGTIFKGAVPFLIANILTLLMIAFMPPLSTWLPTLLITK